MVVKMSSAWRLRGGDYRESWRLIRIPCTSPCSQSIKRHVVMVYQDGKHCDIVLGLHSDFSCRGFAYTCTCQSLGALFPWPFGGISYTSEQLCTARCHDFLTCADPIAVKCALAPLKRGINHVPSSFVNASSPYLVFVIYPFSASPPKTMTAEWRQAEKDYGAFQKQDPMKLN